MTTIYTSVIVMGSWLGTMGRWRCTEIHQPRICPFISSYWSCYIWELQYSCNNIKVRKLGNLTTRYNSVYPNTFISWCVFFFLHHSSSVSGDLQSWLNRTKQNIAFTVGDKGIEVSDSNKGKGIQPLLAALTDDLTVNSPVLLSEKCRRHLKHSGFLESRVCEA